MPAGYSGTPLINKLGIKDGMRMTVINPPAHYWDLLGELPDVEVVGRRAAQPDLVHVFATRRAIAEQEITSWRRRIPPAGVIWVSWPKKSAKVPTDITEDIVRAIALKIGLVDIKVCAVDETWSGLKL